MTGQEAVKIAEGFDEALGLTGCGDDARWTAMLAAVRRFRFEASSVSRSSSWGSGRVSTTSMHAGSSERLAGRILQMGDVVGLVERAQVAIDEEEQEKLQKKVLGQGRFTLEDFLVAMRQVQRMGPLEQILKLIPGAGKLKIPAANLDPKRFKHVEAIILSMTPEERRKPDDPERVADAPASPREVAGPISEVNRLLKQFKEMQGFMKQMRGMMGGMGGLPGMPFGR